MTKIYKSIDILWDYMQLHETLQPADLILVLCSNDVRVAEHAAKLYHQGLAPKLLFSGAQGRFTEQLFDQTEAEVFSQIAADFGVPKHAMILETQATNTGENITFSYQVLKKQYTIPQRIILVQKPFMERRSYATFKKQWPADIESVMTTSQAGSFIDYLNEDLPIDLVIPALIADFERIRDYPALGFQTEQAIPQEVMSAYKIVKNLGF